MPGLIAAIPILCEHAKIQIYGHRHGNRQKFHKPSRATAEKYTLYDMRSRLHPSSILFHILLIVPTSAALFAYTFLESNDRNFHEMQSYETSIQVRVSEFESGKYDYILFIISWNVSTMMYECYKRVML
jgi:hypothetical protein